MAAENIVGYKQGGLWKCEKNFIEAAKTILYSLKEGDSVENMSKQQQLV